MKRTIKKRIKAKPHDAATENRELFWGEYERPVKDGRFSMPKQFQLFNGKKMIAFRKSQDFAFLTLLPQFPKTLDRLRTLCGCEPEIIKHISIGSRGMVDLGRDVCRRVFNKLDFNGIIFGAVNGIQIWNKNDKNAYDRDHE